MARLISGKLKKGLKQGKLRGKATFEEEQQGEDRIQCLAGTFDNKNPSNVQDETVFDNKNPYHAQDFDAETFSK